MAPPPPGLKLLIPVAGVKPEQLRDTFAAARSEGRTHNALDIMAPRDTPVLAAADGKIIRLFASERGGITLYQLSKDEKVVFYYAHLSGYAEGLAVERVVRQGEVIAYVGDTGNAGAGNYHLHFAVWIVDDPKRFWNGLNLNPYPLLKEAR
jgi:murein DD-endopeptidase MepM/ murein hydrolase activator NlpD